MVRETVAVETLARFAISRISIAKPTITDRHHSTVGIRFPKSSEPLPVPWDKVCGD